MMRHSKLQLQVLQLYKQFLRLAVDKPGAKSRIQLEFRKGSKIARTDVLRIEYMLRRGQRQLETLRTSSVVQLGTFVKGGNNERG